MPSKIRNSKFKIAIVGAGPSGTGLAIRLAQENFSVTLIEREKFPRRKLCGEFISPECLEHFRELGVLNEMLASGGDRISETVFYEPNGRSVGVSSKWFGNNAESALSLSRATMDFCLLEKAREFGVEVLEETQVFGILFESNEIRAVKMKSKSGETTEIDADVFVDATGRACVLSKLIEREANSGFRIQDSKSKIENRNSKINNENQKPKTKNQNRLVGFKTHLKNVDLEKGVCEIYFFSGGYGGLSFVENNLANHCFLVKAETVKKFNSDAEKIVREVIFQNKRAAETLKNAQMVEDWLAVSVEGFGQKELNPATNLFAVGDAAAFIDPFTGSGMLMAFESAKILAGVITENNFAPERIGEIYKHLHEAKFRKRLRVCSLLRKAAFVPNLAASAIRLLSLSSRLRFKLARATRTKISDIT